MINTVELEHGNTEEPGHTLTVRWFINITTGLFLVFCNTLDLNAQSPDQSFKAYIEERSTLNVEIDTLTKSEFDKAIVDLMEESPAYNVMAARDSLVYRLKDVRRQDSCLYISGIKEKVRICNKKGMEDRAGETYRFLDEKCGFVIIENGGYEWHRYILINMETNESFQFRDIPVFIGCDYAYSYGNDYDEGQFTLYDLAGKRKINIDFNNWSLSGCFRSGNDFYMAFLSNYNSRKGYFIHLEFE